MTIPSYERRSFTEIAVDTTLSVSISNSDTAIVLTASTGWPTGSGGDFYIRIESETIRVDTRTSNTLTVLTGGRGANSTTAVAHSAGVAVTLVYSAFDADEANYAVSKTVGAVTTQGDLLVADAANSLARVAKGTSGLPLVAGASTVSYVALAAGGIASDAVTTAKILDANVTTAKLATGAVTAAKITAATITATELASNSVTTAKITDANVTTAKVADAAITQAKFASGILPTAVATSAPSGVAGQMWYDSDDNLLYVYNGSAWVCITPQSATVVTAQTTTSTSYTALSTAGPVVTITTGTKALVTLSAFISNTGSSGEKTSSMSFAVSGATTVSSATNDTAGFIASGQMNSNLNDRSSSATFLVTGLTAGANIFTSQYKVSGGTGTFSNRHLTVVGIP